MTFSNHPFTSEMDAELHVIRSLANKYKRASPEEEALTCAFCAIHYVFTHDTEEDFMTHHIRRDTREPKDDTVEDIADLWLSRDVPLQYLQGQLKGYCNALIREAHQYPKQSPEYKAISVGLRCLIHFLTLGKESELLTHMERLVTHTMEEAEAILIRLWVKKMGMWPPGFPVRDQ